MGHVDLTLPFAALLVLVAGAVGYWTGRTHIHGRGFTGDVDRKSPDVIAFEKRNSINGA